MIDDSAVKAIKGLTVAVWALVALLLVGSIAPLAFSLFAPRVSSNAGAVTRPDAGPPPEETIRLEEEYNSFHEWPVEKQIASASAVLLTTTAIVDGRVVSTVEEVLLQRPGTTLYYKVGDNYGHSEQTARPNTSYGDGELVFFTGTPPRLRYSVTYSNGRVGGLGDMPLEHFRELVAKDGGT